MFHLFIHSFHRYLLIECPLDASTVWRLLDCVLQRLRCCRPGACLRRGRTPLFPGLQPLWLPGFWCEPSASTCSRQIAIQCDRTQHVSSPDSSWVQHHAFDLPAKKLNTFLSVVPWTSFVYKIILPQLFCYSNRNDLRQVARILRDEDTAWRNIHISIYQLMFWHKYTSFHQWDAPKFKKKTYVTVFLLIGRKFFQHMLLNIYPY